MIVLGRGLWVRSQISGLSNRGQSLLKTHRCASVSRDAGRGGADGK